MAVAVDVSPLFVHRYGGAPFTEALDGVEARRDDLLPVAIHEAPAPLALHRGKGLAEAAGALVTRADDPAPFAIDEADGPVALTGDEFRSTFDGIVGAAEELEKLLRDEKQAHERTWGRRAQVHENLARKTAAIDGSIRGILEAPTAGAKVIDFPAKVGRRMRA